MMRCGLCNSFLTSYHFFFSAKLFYPQPFYTTAMKKHLLLPIAAAVILAVVLCTAGCIEAPSDPIVGGWVSETDGSVTYAVFENGGAGYFAADKDSVLTLEWKANGDTTYTFLFADGKTETASLDAEHGLMNIGGVEYQKYPSGHSGATGPVKSEPWYSATVRETD